jgi:hypothetical protein
MRWDNAYWEAFNDSGDKYRNGCQVLIEENRIVIEYFEDGRNLRWEGRQVGEGHFRLRRDSLESATLHQFSKQDWLEGHWRETGEAGYWRVHLGDATAGSAKRIK